MLLQLLLHVAPIGNSFFRKDILGVLHCHLHLHPPCLADGACANWQNRFADSMAKSGLVSSAAAHISALSKCMKMQSAVPFQHFSQRDIITFQHISSNRMIRMSRLCILMHLKHLCKAFCIHFSFHGRCFRCTFELSEVSSHGCR